jgi:GLPGLI family protein
MDRGPLKIEQGEILYELSYPQFGDDNLIASMFPSIMSFKFKDNMTRSDLKTRMAIFSTTFITDKDNRTLIHLVKIANKKSGLVLDSAEIMEDYAKKPEGMNVTLTDSTKLIASYTCKHALVTFEGKPEKTFDLYYTEEITINDPNWCSPFQEIPGVLMEARVKKFNIEMHITASQVIPGDYDSAEFSIDSDFEPITSEEMADIFQSF